MLLLEELDRQLHQVLSSGKDDGEDILRKLLQTSRQVASVSEHVARRMLRMLGSREISGEEDSG